jgi:hypothetical protein
MRIDLLDQGRKQSRRRQRRRRRRYRTFDEAITLPELPSGKRPARRRWPGRRSGQEGHSNRVRATEEPRKPRLRGLRWQSIWARIPALLLLVGLVGALVYASTTETFFVYEAEIQGAQRIDAQAVYQAAAIHEQNIFWIQPQEVARQIEQLHGIESASVHCSLPAQVAIQIKEREPAMMWRALSQARDWWLDEEGTVLPFHGDVNSPETIFIVDSSQRNLQVGDQIEPAGIAESVLQLAAAVRGAGVFYYEAERGLYFIQEVAGGNWPVYVGNGQDLPDKIRILQALTDHLSKQSIEPRYVDVRWAAHPVYGLPAGAQPAESE